MAVYDLSCVIVHEFIAIKRDMRSHSNIHVGILYFWFDIRLGNINCETSRVVKSLIL